MAKVSELTEVESESNSDEDFRPSKYKSSKGRVTTKSKLYNANKTVTKSKANNKKGTKKTSVKLEKPKKASKVESKKAKDDLGNGFDPEMVRRLGFKFMDDYYTEKSSLCIDYIDKYSNQLIPADASFQHQGPILGFQFSHDSQILATFGTLDYVKLWDLITNKHLATLKDYEEANIDEFYCGQFSPCQQYLIVGGKRKDRKVWSNNDNDNKVMNCDIKVFDLLTGNVINRLEAHTEEVLSIKQVYFKGESFYISTGQDGYIWRWKLSTDHSEIISKLRMVDDVTCIAFNVSFLPNCGNKYFLAACDDGIKLFDFEVGKVIQIFESPYSSYCDNVKFIQPHPEIASHLLKEDLNSSAYEFEPPVFFISRGVELLDDDGHLLSDTSNSLNLHRLIYPTEKAGKFKMVDIKRYQEYRYTSNSWYAKPTCNGRYIAAPTVYGAIVLFDLLSGSVVDVLKQNADVEIRDIKFHPTTKKLYCCGEDGKVSIFEQVSSLEEVNLMD